MQRPGQDHLKNHRIGFAGIEVLDKFAVLTLAEGAVSLQHLNQTLSVHSCDNGLFLLQSRWITSSLKVVSSLRFGRLILIRLTSRI